MKFLIDADSPRSLVEIFKKHGHAAVHVRDVLVSSPLNRLNNIKMLLGHCKFSN